MNALIIDGQAMISNAIMSALLDIGLRNVKTAENAYFALRLCEFTEFDIVLISFNVKSDKDGFHLFEEMKFKGYITKSTSVIFLSADTAPSLVNSVVELQPSDFWVKPLDSGKMHKKLTHLLGIKEKLHKLNYCMDQNEYATAIYYAERQLKDPLLKQFFPYIHRIIGDCLHKLMEYSDAEEYYRKLAKKYKFGWVQLGIIWAMLKQDKFDDAQPLIKELSERDDTKFLIFDLLAEYYIEKEDYPAAYAEIQKATELAPRNINRNKKSCDLARLNHDKKGQYTATQNMAKYAKNSIHDSPELRLNQIRSAIDLATTIPVREAASILKRMDREIINLEDDYGNAAELKSQLSTIKIRMHNVRDEKDQAEKILEENMSVDIMPSVEDNLDRVKAFHELGYREECLQLLDNIKGQIEGDSFSSRVVSDYIEQESIERREIHFTPNELSEMAANNYKLKRMAPALSNLSQAFKLSPENSKFAMSMLKILAILKEEEGMLDEHQTDLAKDVIKQLTDTELAPEFHKKLEFYMDKIALPEEVEIANENDLN